MGRCQQGIALGLANSVALVSRKIERLLNHWRQNDPSPMRNRVGERMGGHGFQDFAVFDARGEPPPNPESRNIICHPLGGFLLEDIAGLTLPPEKYFTEV